MLGGWSLSLPYGPNTKPPWEGMTCGTGRAEIHSLRFVGRRSGHRPSGRRPVPIFDRLIMRLFGVIMMHVVSHRSPQVPFAEHDHPVEALRLDR